MSNKTLKELYGDFWKEFQKFITEVSFGILCLFPILLFFAYLFILGEEVPATLDCILAVVFNLVYVPLPAWLWVHRHYSFTVPEYVLEVLKFYFYTCPLLMVMICVPFLVLFLPIWLSLLMIFLLGCSKIVGVIIVVCGIVLNVPWGPFGTWLINKIFDLCPN